MKKMFKKLIICLLVVLMLFNFLTTSVGKLTYVYADDDAASTVETETESLLGGVLNGLAGIITWIPRAMMTGVAALMQLESYFIVNSAGHGDNEVNVLVTPLDIFFNNFTLTNINIFTTDDLADENGNVDTDGLVYKIRSAAAMWFYIFRVLAAAVLLVMLIFIAIRAALATLASEKAKYKMLFRDWLVSAILVMFMTLIVVAVVNVNELIVDVFKDLADASNMDEMISSLRSAAFSINFLLGWGATIAYFLLAVQTMIYTYIYIKRFFIVTFLIIISPLMPLAYSVDRAKGKQSGAMNGWLREFMYNVLIQPIHCLLYLVILGTILSGLGTSIGSLESLAESILLIVGFMFIPKAEQLLKSLFGFDKATTLSSLQSVTNAVSNVAFSAASFASASTGNVALSNVFANQVNNTNNVNNTTNNTTTPTFAQRAGNAIHNARNTAADYLQNAANGASDAASGVAGAAGAASGAAGSSQNMPSPEGSNLGDGAVNGAGGAGGTTPMALPILADGEEVGDKIANAVAKSQENQEREEEENKNNTNLHIENSDEKSEKDEENEENDNETNENKSSRVLTKEQKEERVIVKSKYGDMIEDIKAGSDLQKELLDKLEELEKQLGENSDEIKSQIEELFDKEGEESAKKYADSLGNSPEGEFAKEYVKLLSNQKALDGMLDAGDGDLINLMDQAVDSGALDNDEAWKLFDNAINVKEGQEDKSNEIFEIKENDNTIITESSQITDNKNEVLTGEVVEINDELKLPKDVVRTAVNTSKLATINTSKLMEALNADISIQGNANYNNLIKFNKEVFNRSSSMTKEDLGNLYTAVQKEGDEEVRRVKAYEENMTVENAQRIKTKAGQTYAQAVTMNRQAGVFVVSAQMAQKQSLQSENNISQSVTQSRQIMRANNPTSSSNNVINDINNRKNGNNAASA